MAKEAANITSDSFSHAVERRLSRMRVLARLCTMIGVLILAALAIVGLGAAVVPRVIGMQSYAIISGSMEPAYPTGTLVYAESIDGTSLQPGDVAAFWRDEDVIVHRVEKNNAEEGELTPRVMRTPIWISDPFPISTCWAASWPRCLSWGIFSWPWIPHRASFCSAGLFS